MILVALPTSPSPSQSSWQVREGEGKVRREGGMEGRSSCQGREWEEKVGKKKKEEEEKKKKKKKEKEKEK